MVFQWKERGHEAEEFQASQDPACINVLRDYGLLKFFRTIGLRAQMEILHYLISLWDVDQENFTIKGKNWNLRRWISISSWDYPTEEKKLKSLDLTKEVRVPGV